MNFVDLEADSNFRSAESRDDADFDVIVQSQKPVMW